MAAVLHRNRSLWQHVWSHVLRQRHRGAAAKVSNKDQCWGSRRERDEREGQRAKTFFLSRNCFHVFLLSGNHTVYHLHTVDIVAHSVASTVSVVPSQSEEWNVSRTSLCSEECAVTPVQPAEVSDATSHPVWQPVLLTAHR